MLSPTDLSRWHLKVEEGRQTWSYSAEGGDNAPQSIHEKYFLGLPISSEEVPDLPDPRNLEEVASNAVDFYQRLLTDDGHWANDYGGPMFLMPGLIITCFISNTDLGVERRAEMIRYLRNQQREDGGWGLHIESPSTIFGSALSYASLRILGLDADDDTVKKGRAFLQKSGGAEGIPSWGKFWLAVLGCYEWEGLNPIPPEFWLLPYSVPVHPGRWWCHCRMVYLPMGYIYARRSKGPITPLILELRKEMFVQDYDAIVWDSMRNHVSPLDMYTPHSALVNTVHWTLLWYEKYHSSWLRQKALKEAMEQIHAEDENTKYICIGPVNKVINMLCVWFDEGESDRFKKHVERIPDYLWLAEDGMKMQGYNGSQLWDTAFSVQAIVATGQVEKYRDTLTNNYLYLDTTQVKEEVPTPNRHYRHVSVGAWPFSTRDHGWPISDCTAEGLKATLLLHENKEFIDRPLISDERLYDAVNVMLSLQNASTGGWATYELQRGSGLIELLNPSETFHGIMVDYPYVECSSACIQALILFQKHYPSHRANEINTAVAKGISFIKSIQRADGSWKGSWAVCFTYGIWFGVEALCAVGETLGTSPEIKKACQFLIAHQREDGGWGESFQSCVQMNWVEHPDGSQIVNTAWAVLTLLVAEWDQEPIKRGVEYMRSKQLANGDWTQEGISGVFNANCAISYSGYKNIFPIWAIGKYIQKYGKEF
eukprot:TRINITY_DN2887_c0_g1_i1.p1 TRINITY_DN2887_c0_g1~~TRINITY_DN2887_c0_g1_i1.p1  ORF type:complete len:720 (+),score=260.70 TRINITY_DN2887_c0_g1_i1:33-2162(+)